jgi:hypothetical protein
MYKGTSNAEVVEEKQEETKELANQASRAATLEVFKK